METITFEFPAAAPARGRVAVGVVGSGDLEVLLEPNTAGRTAVRITTSVGGMGRVWEAVLGRILTATPLPATKIEINDFGATPGVVRMRIEQAFEELNAAVGK
jgi:malonate decarboxylase delta subunit